MRNLKHTYKTIKNNKKTSTGRERIGWEWYNDIENIFREDRTINIDPTLPSMISSGEETNSGEQNVLSSHLSIIAYKGEQLIIASNRSDTDAQTEEDITDDGLFIWCVKTNNLDCFTNASLDFINFYVSNWLKNCAEFKFSSYMYKMKNKGTWYNQFINNHVINKPELFGCYSQTVQLILTINSSLDNISNDLCSKKNRKQKNTRAKALYDLKKSNWIVKKGELMLLMS